MVAAAGYAIEAALAKVETREKKDETWEKFVRERILGPLGMTRTYCTIGEAKQRDNAATPHRRDRKRVIRVIDWYEPSFPDPAGSIVSCARDLCQWALFHLAEGTILRDRQAVELVKRQALAETHAPQNVIPMDDADHGRQPETDQMTYCMGWVRQDYRGKVLLSHAGILDGFRAHVTLLPREKPQLGIVLLSNLHGTDMNLALSNTLVDHFLGLPARDWNTDLGNLAKKHVEKAEREFEDREKHRVKDAKHSRALPAYAGTYRDPVFGDAVVKFKDKEGELVFEWSSFKCPLVHFHFDTFVARDEVLNDPLVNFSLGTDGSVVTMHVLDRYFFRIK
jgi:CubicO group peptidase (beta-lactamase class C family)